MMYSFIPHPTGPRSILAWVPGAGYCKVYRGFNLPVLKGATPGAGIWRTRK